MAVLKSAKRRKIGTKRFDPTSLRDVLKDDRLWTVAAVVVKPDDTSSHFQLISENGKVVDVLIEVETTPEQLQLTCRLGAIGAGAGVGLWAIPKVGTEVLVAIPSGRIEHMPTIVATLSTGDVPGRLEEGRVVLVCDTEVEIQAPTIRLGEAATEAAIKGDLFKVTYDTHIHPSPMGPTGTTTPMPPGNLSSKVKVG